MNARAVERLAALLRDQLPGISMAFWRDVAATIIAAGWGHPDDQPPKLLPDTFVERACRLALRAENSVDDWSVMLTAFEASSIRAALARAFKGEA